MGSQTIKYFVYAGRVAGNVKFALQSPRSKSRASQKKKNEKWMSYLNNNFNADV